MYSRECTTINLHLSLARVRFQHCCEMKVKTVGVCSCPGQTTYKSYTKHDSANRKTSKGHRSAKSKLLKVYPQTSKFKYVQ